MEIDAKEQLLDKLKNKNLFHRDSFVNGKWIEGENRFKVYNPFSKEVLAECADHGQAVTQQAILFAQKAFREWSEYSASKRSKILMNWYRLQLEHIDDLALILSSEQGKPLFEAKGEVKYGAAYVEWFAEEAKRVYGDIVMGHKNRKITVIKQAVGVVGAITPWNFPSAMITRKLAPALAAGCTAVLKPSELTPLSALALAYLAKEAGFPDGVLNIICSNRPEDVGKELCANPIVKKISFTGSTEVGKILLRQSADTVKRMSLELGGNAPFIVFPDANIDDAVKGAVASKYRNAGQTCICSNRLFVHEDIYDEFSIKLAEKTKEISVGNGLDSETQQGPLVEDKALQFVKELVDDARQNGGELMCGGKLHEENTLLFEPTVIRNASRDMRLFKEEIFGPIAPLFRFKTEEEVLELANNTEYGLAAYFYGRDYKQIWRVAESLEYGMVGINTGMISTPVAPFGGVKQSGFGREGSKYGMDDYLNIKYMCWE